MLNVKNRVFLWILLLLVCLLNLFSSKIMIFANGALMICAICFIILDSVDEKYHGKLSIGIVFLLLLYILIWILLNKITTEVLIALIILVFYIILRILMFLDIIPKNILN
jgi:hypothetical protein